MLTVSWSPSKQRNPSLSQAMCSASAPSSKTKLLQVKLAHLALANRGRSFLHHCALSQKSHTFLKNEIWAKAMQKDKTYNRRYSHVVTHRSTNRPLRSLSSGERTGSSIFCELWSYVMGMDVNYYIFFKILFRKSLNRWIENSFGPEDGRR